MSCSLCRNYDVTMNNGLKTWSTAANVRCRTETITSHFNNEYSKQLDAIKTHNRKSTSYFDKQEENKVNHLKNEV